MPSSVGLNPVTLYGDDSPNAVSPASSGDVDGRFALKHVLDHVLCLPITAVSRANLIVFHLEVDEQ